jgi:hypothetical protein
MPNDKVEPHPVKSKTLEMFSVGPLLVMVFAASATLVWITVLVWLLTEALMALF